MTNNATPKITSTQRIYEAVRELRNLEQTATRESVAALTNLRLSIVDDRLRVLVDDGKLKRLLRGIYEMVEQFAPPRPMSCSILTDGQVNFEIGDAVLLFSPQEARSAARALAGFAEDARVIESTRQHLFLATELAAKVKKLELELKAVKQGRDAQQADLFRKGG